MATIQLEQFIPSQEISFDISTYNTLHDENKERNIYKMHEEFELTALYHTSGTRIIGNSSKRFSNDDLFLIGPNLIHLIKADKPKESKAICIHFKNDSFGQGFFELPQNKKIKKLLKRVSLGCHFFGSEISEIKTKIEHLDSLDAFDKMISFLEILNTLSKTVDFEILSSPSYQPSLKVKEAERPSILYDYILGNFHQDLNIEELSKLIHVSPSTFYRIFKKTMNKNFSDFVSEIRIGHACKLLFNTDLDISEISFLSGYKQITNFNRQFKKLMQLTPSAYRKTK